MHCAWHLTRIEKVSLPKQLFYGDLQHIRHRIHKPKNRLKDHVKNELKALIIDTGDSKLIKLVENDL